MKTLDDAVEDVVTMIRAGRTAHDAASAVVRLVLPDDLMAEAAIHGLADLATSRRRAEVLHIERSVANTPTTRNAVRHKRSCQCDECEHRRDISAEIEGRHFGEFMNRMSQIVEQYASELKMQWTAELRRQPFKLGDGTEVTWGEATIEQHQARIDMLSKNAQANLEAASRHRRAVIDITEGRTSTLNQLLEAAA